EYSLAQAWTLLGRVRGSFLGSMGRGEEAWRRALEYAERGDYAAEKAESIRWLMISAIFGPLPAAEGIARCKHFADTAGDDRAIRAFAYVERAVLEAMVGGEFDSARRRAVPGPLAERAGQGSGPARRGQRCGGVGPRGTRARRGDRSSECSGRRAARSRRGPTAGGAHRGGRGGRTRGRSALRAEGQ